MDYFEIHRVITKNGKISMVQGKDREEVIKVYNKYFPSHEVIEVRETNAKELDEYLNLGGLILHKNY